MKKRSIVSTIAYTVLITLLATGCSKNNASSISDSAHQSDDAEDVIASGNGTGTADVEEVELSDDITTFVHIDKNKAPDGVSITAGDEYKIEDCVSLPDLHSMTIVCPLTLITDEDAERYIRINLDANQLHDKNAEAKKWDIATINYTTTYKDIALDVHENGKEIMIGGDLLPKKVENAIIGHHIGDEFSIDVDFPESYSGNSELAGRTITYNVKLLLLSRTPEPTEEEIAKVKSELQRNVDYAAIFDKYEAIVQYITDNATFNAYPRKYVEEARTTYELRFFGDFGTVANYAKKNGMTIKTVKEQEDDWIISYIKRRTLTEAVATNLGVTKESPEFKEKQAEAKYSDNEEDNLMYTALDKIINETKYVAK